VLLASLLMCFDEMAEEFGYNYDIIKTLIHVGHQLDISVSMLRTWGLAVKQQFHHKNAQNLASAVGSSTGSSIVLHKLLMERDHHREMIADLKSDVKRLTIMVESLLATAQTPSSPTMRRAASKRSFDSLEKRSNSLTCSSSTKVEANNEGHAPQIMITEPKNAFAEIVSGGARLRSGPHFPNILHMNISELIEQVIIQGININATACFGSVNLISKQNRKQSKDCL